MKKGWIVVLSACMGAITGGGIVWNKQTTRLKKIEKCSDKHLTLFLMMNQWVMVKQSGKKLSDYFIEKNYRKIAVYGMSYVGRTLVEELKNTEVSVVYGIDKNARSIYADVKVLSMEDELEEIDAVVVTAVTFFEEAKTELCRKINCPVISLKDILYETLG